MAVTVVISVFDEQGTPQPVNDVIVRIFDAADTTQLAQNITGSGAEDDGEATFSLDGVVSPGTNYLVRLQRAGWTIPAGPTQLIAVIEPEPAPPNTFDFTAHQLVLKESVDPLMCTLQGTFKDISRQPLAGLELFFSPKPVFLEETPILGLGLPSDPTVVTRDMLARSVSRKTSKTGYVEIELPRFGYFDVRVSGLEDPVFERMPIVVPNAAGFELEGVLFPFLETVVYAPTSVSVVAGAIATVAMTATLSDTRVLTTSAGFNELLTFTSDDEDIATVVLSGTSLQITGIAAGTANITVARVAGSFPIRRPVPAAPAVALVVTVS